ncbi:MAG: mycofactocin biosynthesis glycosyltransferase MftF, partial [Actinobacteria bacterium]|nr:mycofactocin biosynthesis glycosyltransferase MftF [Actinomycetota bacterium]
PFRCAGAGLVVVDDASADGAAHRGVAEEHGATYLRRDRPGGPAAARDDGIAAVTTPVVAVIDSDCEVSEGAGRWWDAPLRLLSDERTAAVAPRIRTPIGPRLLQRYEALRSPLDLGADPARVSPGTRVSYVPAAALLLRTDRYRAVGGFDRDLRVGEDVDLIWQLVASGHRVRFEPTVTFEHPARPGVLGWIRQRFDYGTSAAPLEIRHPGQVAPVRCSPWSAAGWTAVAVGHPVIGLGILGASAALLPRRLVDIPRGEALRLAVSGHGSAGAQLARAAVRVWWPALVVMSTGSSRARRILAASVAVTAAQVAVDARRQDPSLGIGSLAAVAGMGVLDDMAYGLGVWSGCMRTRSARALLPRFPRSSHRF